MKKLLLFSLVLFVPILAVSLCAQQKISGTVTSSEDGTPLPGVNILIKNSSLGTVTDIDGNFVLEISADITDAVLVFSYVGFLTEEISLNGESQITISLSPDLQKLDEVVVIGYGVQKKSDLTGSVTSVNAEELQKIPSQGIESALQGRAAGVQVSQNTGAPGSGVTIRVRGVSTLSTVDDVNQGQPIWIVDGVPAGPNSVNPNDIESIEILKDASAAAIYGSKGAKGVILITTKKGKSEKPRVSINYYHGVQSVPNRINVANGPQFADMYSELEATRGNPVTQFTDIEGTESYDYQDMIFRDASIDNLDFSVSGGNEKTSVYLGLGYLNQEGILKASSYERFNFRLNSSY